MKYRTTNWKAYHEALKARGALTMWLVKEMQWLTERGRSQIFSDAAIQFRLRVKCLFGLALRQTLGLVETNMHCFKRLGECVTARTFERPVVELHVRVAFLNRFRQIGRP